MYIKKIDQPEIKASIVATVLYDLPEWFGLPESTQNYIAEARDLPLWAAFEEQANEAIGFVTLSNTSESCGNVHCMGVKKTYHRQGIGRQLMQALEQEACQSYLFLQVKTVDEGHYVEYDQTIRFYKRCGFKKIEVFPTLWDEWNPCLMMLKQLN